ncbi:MAG: hypothetical protein K0R09_882 [Clostridiales bacterium]|jgi:uncharacterized protein YybS (DUF2232 family)|nr:hypothetical protein [Clostridiales bacterium]
MNRENSTRALVESGVLTGVAVVLMLISLYIPVISMITLFIWPLPITLIYIRHNVKYSILALIVTCLITAMVSDPFSALWFTFIFGIMSVVMGYCAKSKKTASVTLLYMGITNFICIIGVFYGFSFIAGQDLLGQFKMAIEQSMALTKNMYSSMGVPQETIDTTLKQFDIKRMMMIIPGTLVLFSAFVSYVTYSFAGFLFKRFGYNLNKIKPFSEWYMPFQIAMGIIGFTFLGYFLNAKGVGIGESLFLNSVTIFRLIFIMVGLCSAAFFLKKRGMAKGIIVVILLFAAITPISSVIELLGVLDYSLDLRKLDTNRKKFAKKK